MLGLHGIEITISKKKKIGFPINEGISCESDHSQKGLLVLSELKQDQILVCEWGVVVH